MSKLLPQRTEARFVLAIVAVIVGFNVIAIGVDALVPSPEGPRSSSFATSPEGIAAWAELARRSGRRRARAARAAVRRLAAARGHGRDARPGGLHARAGARAAAVRRARRPRGRRRADPGAWLSGLGAPPAWDNGASEDARVVVPSRATGAAAASAPPARATGGPASDALPLVAGSDGAVVLAAPHRQGRDRARRRPVAAAEPAARRGRQRGARARARRRRPARLRGGPARLRRRRPGSPRCPPASTGRSACSRSARCC